MKTRAAIAIAAIIAIVAWLYGHDQSIAAAIGCVALAGLVGLLVTGWIMIVFRGYSEIEQ